VKVIRHGGINMETTGMKDGLIKRALVTGSSRGIGRGIAIKLAEVGYEVIVHCSGNRAKAEETAEIIRSQGGRAVVLQADLSNVAQTKRLAAEMGDIDVLVLNASIQIRRSWAEIPVEECYTQLN
jgi:3-oxoacyl-[acyl-carrier protein] reductase